MTYFCFIESSLQSVPHMEPLLVQSHDAAVEEARALMRLHSSATLAHIVLGEERVATLNP